MPSRQYVDRLTLNPAPGLSGDGFNKVNIFAGAGSPDGVLSASLGDRYFQIASTNKWVCNGGTSWSLDDGGDPASFRYTFTYQPGGTDDPDNGIFTDFSEAHAAAALVADDTNELVTLIIDDKFTSPAVGDGGVYDFRNIKMAGWGWYEIGSDGGQAFFRTGNATYLNFTQGADGMLFEFNGADGPMFTPTELTTNVINLGFHSSWRATAGAPIFRASAAAGPLVVYTAGWNYFMNGGGGNAPVFSVASPNTIELRLTGYANFSNDVLGGNVGSSINIEKTSLSGFIDSDQSTFAGTLTLITPTADTLSYTPGQPSDWTGSPDNVQEALDRLAAHVGPVP